MSYLDDEQVFDKAYYVEFNGDVIYVWNGSHTVNIYIRQGAGEYANPDMFSVGDFAQDKASLEEAQAAIRERIEQPDEDDE